MLDGRAAGTMYGIGAGAGARRGSTGRVAETALVAAAAAQVTGAGVGRGAICAWASSKWRLACSISRLHCSLVIDGSTTIT